MLRHNPVVLNGINHPVHFRVPRAGVYSRLQLLTRLVAFMALAILGVSFGMIFLFAYLALPAYAATRAAVHARSYMNVDAPRIARALHWLGAICAWAILLTERLPTRDPAETVSFSLDGGPPPEPRAALLRIVSAIPSALAFWFLCLLAVPVGLWAALSILYSRRIGRRSFDYLEGVLRWQLRLLAFQASLVAAYPPFSFADTPPEGTVAPPSGAVTESPAAG